MYYYLAQSHAQELVMIELNPEERYQLRKLQLDIETTETCGAGLMA